MCYFQYFGDIGVIFTNTYQHANSLTNILIEPLVMKSIDSATNVKIREELINDTKLASSDIVISILGVGTFSLVDIERMRTWHEVSKKLTKARKLVKFVEKIVIDDDHKEVERQRILHMIPFMNVDSVFSANGHNISFLDLAGYGGDQWLSDSCVFLASLRVVKEAEPQTWQNPKYVTVVDPLYLQLSDVERRNQYIDTKDHIFTEMRSNRIVCCPTYVDIEFPHWCGIIFDMERKIVWKYDPLHKKSILDAVQEVISGVFMKFMSSHMEMQAKTFTGWRQCDGHSCGVLVVQWLEQYLSLVRSTPPDASIPLAHDDKLDPKQLAYERYKHFSYVLDSVVTNVDT